MCILSSYSGSRLVTQYMRVSVLFSTTVYSHPLISPSRLLLICPSLMLLFSIHNSVVPWARMAAPTQPNIHAIHSSASSFGWYFSPTVCRAELILSLLHHPLPSTRMLCITAWMNINTPFQLLGHMSSWSPLSVSLFTHYFDGSTFSKSVPLIYLDLTSSSSLQSPLCRPLALLSCTSSSVSNWFSYLHSHCLPKPQSILPLFDIYKTQFRLC